MTLRPASLLLTLALLGCPALAPLGEPGDASLAPDGGSAAAEDASALPDVGPATADAGAPDGAAGGDSGGATVDAGGPALPDLVVEEVGWAPAEPVAGEPVVFSAKVANRGAAATPEGTVLGVSFWVDGAQVSWSDDVREALAPGASRTLIASGGKQGASWRATLGAHTVRAWVDDVDRLREGDELNNERETSLRVAGEPTPQWPFDRPALQALRASPRKVFAHWHWFPLSLDDGAPTSDHYANGYLTVDGEGGKHAAYGGYLRERPLPRLKRGQPDWRRRDAELEIALAKEIGIDGFFLNVWETSGSLRDTWLALFDGAASQGDFVIAPNFDLVIMAGLGDQALSDAIVGFLGTVKDEPALYRLADGRVVVGAFAAEKRTPAFFQALLARLEQELGLQVCLVPVFLGTGSAALFASFAPVASVLAGWGTAIPQAPGAAQAVADRAKTHGRPWMHPVLVQDFRPSSKSFWEAENTLTERSGWETVIASDQEWAQIVTWNDQAEHHALRPATGKQWAAYDLAAYYVTWFKTGQRPAIVRDALYYSHRVHAFGAVPTQQTALAACQANCPGRDEVELLAFLTAPGTLEVELGGKVTQREAPAGMTSFKVPLQDGRPVFRLRRGGREEVVLPSAFDVRSQVTRQDLLYRSGGSLRAKLLAGSSCQARCEAQDAAGCERCPGEPMWLVANPP